VGFSPDPLPPPLDDEELCRTISSDWGVFFPLHSGRTQSSSFKGVQKATLFVMVVRCALRRANVEFSLFSLTVFHLPCWLSLPPHSLCCSLGIILRPWGDTSWFGRGKLSSFLGLPLCSLLVNKVPFYSPSPTEVSQPWYVRRLRHLLVAHFPRSPPPFFPHTDPTKCNVLETCPPPPERQITDPVPLAKP